MDGATFDALVSGFGTRSSRRGFLGRAAKIAAGAAVVSVAGRATAGRASAATCPYGAFTCQQGYVWREAFPGDIVCVEPWVRDQMAYDNANQYGRYDPNGAYGEFSCVSGYVWRDAYDGDGVCVTPETRSQVHYDNSQAAYRIEPGCALETQV